jgi:hypothetical protein
MEEGMMFFNYCIARIARGQVFFGTLALFLASLVVIAAISSLFHYLTRLLMLDPAIALWIFLPAFYFSFKWFLVSLSVMIEAYFSFLGVYKLFDIRGCPVREEVVRKYGRNS